MNRKIRFIIAIIVTLTLLVVGTTVWAGSKESSLGPTIHDVTQACNTTINMGDATFTMTVAGEEVCTFQVIRLKVPNTAVGSPPDGLEFRSDGFQVIGPENRIGMLEVCFAHTPLDAEKNAQVFAVFGSQSAILPSIKIGDDPVQMCAAIDILSGIFAVVGEP